VALKIKWISDAVDLEEQEKVGKECGQRWVGEVPF
jgi:hypothetical protein